MSYDCAYCFEDVEQNEHGAWIDNTGSDRCPGDTEGTNENGTHNVFDPVAGYSDVCVKFLHDPYTDNESICFRCFHHITSHKAGGTP